MVLCAYLDGSEPSLMHSGPPWTGLVLPHPAGTQLDWDVGNWGARSVPISFMRSNSSAAIGECRCHEGCSWPATVFGVDATCQVAST